MKIITKKQVEESIDIKVPMFISSGGSCVKITRYGLVKVYDTWLYSVANDANDFSREIGNALENHIEITEEEFNEKFATTIENIGLLAGISNVPTLQLQD